MKDQVKKVLIVGGVAGGASCAARLRRLEPKAEITLIEAGPHISFANCGLPYFVGDVITRQEDLLLQTPEGFSSTYNVKVWVNSRATRILKGQKTLVVQRGTSEQGQETEEVELHYDSLVLSPGASPIVPPLPGLKEEGVFTLRNVPDAVRMKDWAEKTSTRRAVVVGGGFIGLETAENLVHRGLEVILLEKMNQVMPPLDADVAKAVQSKLEDGGVRIHLGEGLSGIEKNADGSLKILTDLNRELQGDMVVLAIGVRPENQLAKDAGLELGPRGHIVVDDHMQTSEKGIYAVGDVIEVVNRQTGQKTALPLAGPANRQGRIAADHIAGRNSAFGGVQGTSILGVFGMAVASTGLSEKALKQSGREDFAVSLITRTQHVGYYPGATPIHFKLVYRKPDGLILGAQAFGEDGVDRRVDIVAMAIQMNATVYDLAESELCYSPQYGSGKDLINIAAMVAVNELEGLCDFIHWENLPKGSFVLDVRPIKMANDNPYPEATNIPLSQLRGKIEELSRGPNPINVLCHVGQTAYNAHRLLRQEGIDSRVIAGGMSWRKERLANKSS